MNPNDYPSYTEETISVQELEIDHAIQRDQLDTRKIERMVRDFNPAALGVITVSRRNKVTLVILDGAHRVETVRRITSGVGEVRCHVFTGLTKAQEADIFLDLNAGNQPTLLEKFKARLVKGDQTAIEIDKLTRAYGWSINRDVVDGHIQCVGALEKIYRRSIKGDHEPNLLLIALLVASHAWGNKREGVKAVILDGIAALYAEHGSHLEIDRLVNMIRNYPGGPAGLHMDAMTMAATRRMRTAMAVASQLTDEYNRGLQQVAKKRLSPWRYAR